MESVSYIDLLGVAIDSFKGISIGSISWKRVILSKNIVSGFDGVWSVTRAHLDSIHTHTLKGFEIEFLIKTLMLCNCMLYLLA